jgi:membrane protease YdiL (CAAX protease family)
MIGVLGPLFAAVVVARRHEGGVRRLFASLRPRNTRLFDVLFALFLPALLLSGVLWLLRAAGREGPVVYLPDAGRLVVGALIALVEEIGWRGVAQPQLARRHGAFGAAGVVGVMWTLWHVPMFVGAGVSLAWLPTMMLSFVGGSLVLGWLQRRTLSLLPVVAAHFGAHLDSSHLALPADGLPLVVHAIVFATLGLLVTPLPQARVGRGRSPTP